MTILFRNGNRYLTMKHVGYAHWLVWHLVGVFTLSHLVDAN